MANSGNRLTDEQIKKIYELSVNSEYQREEKVYKTRCSFEKLSVPNNTKIGREVGCSASTISYVLNPNQRLKSNITKNEYYHSAEGNRKHNEYMGDYLKDYRKTSGGMAVIERYEHSEKGIKSKRKRNKNYNLRNYIGIQKGIRALAVLMDEFDNI